MSTNKTPRVMVAGAGYWGKNLVRNFHGLGALATVCDTNAEQREALVAQYPGSKGSNDYAESLADPALDAVAIATPAPQHGEMVRAAPTVCTPRQTVGVATN